MYPEKPIFLKTGTTTQNTPVTPETFLVAANNLSDLTDIPLARQHLGLGTAALRDASSFDAAGAAAAALAAAEAYANSLVGGFVVGPASSTDGHLALFDGVTGKLLKDGNPSDASLSFYLSVCKADRFSYTLQTDGTTGAVVLNLTSSNRFYIGMTGNVTFTFAGFANEFKGVLLIHNTTGGALTLAWPACSVSGDALPTAIAAGAWYTIPFEITGTTLASVVLYYRKPSNTGTVTSVTTAGRFISSSPNPIVSSGTITGVDSNHFNVADYGAVPNSSGAAGANITAISTAIAALIAAGGGCLFFPNGTWYVNSLIDFSTTSVPVTIEGEGMLTTTVVQTAADTGVFNWLQGARDTCLTIKDIRLAHNNATSISAAAAVEIGNSVDAANDSAPNLRAVRVDIRCDSGANKTFTYGFRCSNIKVSLFDGCSFTGDNSSHGTGIQFQKYGGGVTQPGIKCIGAQIMSCNFVYAHTAVRVMDALEGMYLTNCQMVGLVYGINADYCIHLGINNTHISASVDINATGTGGGVDQLIVTGCLLYQGSVNFVGIQGDFSRGVISGNNFVAYAGDAGTKGVNLTGGSGMAIVGNSFYDCQSTYVTTAGSHSIVSSNCATKSVTTATNPYLDSGATNTFVNNINA